MATFNDELTKEMDKYLQKQLKISQLGTDIIKKNVDKSANKVFKDIKDSTPVKTGGLKNSLVMEKVDNGRYYGYRIRFDGYNKQGVAYQIIANSLNYGATRKTGFIAPTRFVSKNLSQLKKLDKQINEDFIKQAESIEKGGN